jgi:Fur family transcriptional regulator, peroxide stress response regulator
MSASLARYSDLLRSKGIRPSFQRLLILEYMDAVRGHPTADEIFRSLAPDNPCLSKGTVYNTLHAFVEAGVVRVLTIDETELRYDVTLSEHGHFQCDACGVIYNFEVNMAQILIDGQDEFEITQRNIYFKGLCPNCVKQSKTNPLVLSDTNPKEKTT